MRIESVDFYYLSMPEVLDIGDGSQDLLLVRLQAGAVRRLGRMRGLAAGLHRQPRLPDVAQRLQAGAAIPCSARRWTTSPTSTASAIWCAPTASICCKPNHTLSGIDIAMWDLLGRRLETPVYKLLGYARPSPKPPYASSPLRRHAAGDAGRRRAASATTATAPPSSAGGPMGWGAWPRTPTQVAAAREGLGADGILLVDAGTVWGDDVASGRRRAYPRCRRAAPPGWRSHSCPARSTPIAPWPSESGSVAHRRRRGRAQRRHGPPHDRPRRHRLHPDRRRPHRRHRRRRKRGGRLRARAGRDLRQSHLHLAPGAQRLPAALRRARRPAPSASTRSN